MKRNDVPLDIERNEKRRTFVYGKKRRTFVYGKKRRTLGIEIKRRTLEIKRNDAPYFNLLKERRTLLERKGNTHLEAEMEIGTGRGEGGG